MLIASTSGKLVSFHEFLELREQEKITGGQVWGLLKHSNVIFGKKFPDT